MVGGGKFTVFVTENQTVEVASGIEIGGHNGITSLNVHIPHLARRLAHLGPAELLDLGRTFSVRTLGENGVQKIDSGSKSFDSIGLLSGGAGKRPPLVSGNKFTLHSTDTVVSVFVKSRIRGKQIEP